MFTLDTILFGNYIANGKLALLNLEFLLLLSACADIYCIRLLINSWS